MAGERQRDAGHHQPNHQHLVVHATHQVNDHQRVQHADPQRGRTVGADMASHPRRRPDQQGQAGQHAQPQQHGAGHHVVAHQHRDELGDQDERGPVGRGRRRPDRTHVVQQRVRIVDRADDVWVEAVAQQCALRQIRIGVAAEHGNATAAVAPARTPSSPPSCIRLRCGRSPGGPATARRSASAPRRPTAAPTTAQGRDRIAARTGAATRAADRAAGCCPRQARRR